MWSFITRILMIGLLPRWISPTNLVAVRTRSPLPFLRPHLQALTLLNPVPVLGLAQLIEVILGL